MRESIRAVFAAARPRGATLVAWLLVAAYIAYLTYPVAAPATPFCPQ